MAHQSVLIGESRVRGLLGGGWPDRRVCGTAEAVCDAGARTSLLCSLLPPNQHPIQPGGAPPSGRLPAAWRASRRYQAAQQPELPGLKCPGQNLCTRRALAVRGSILRSVNRHCDIVRAPACTYKCQDCCWRSQLEAA